MTQLESSSQKSDLELVQDAKQGNKTAYELLVRRYQGQVLGLAYRMLGHYEDSKELAQDVFYRAWRGLPGFRGEAAFRTWLFQITANLARNRRRWYARHHTNRTLSLDAPLEESASEEEPTLGDQMIHPGPTPREEASRALLRQRLLTALQKIPAAYREILVLRDMKQLEYQEIAQICKQPIGTIKSRLHRGRALLREQLGTEGIF